MACLFIRPWRGILAICGAIIIVLLLFVGRNLDRICSGSRESVRQHFTLRVNVSQGRATALFSELLSDDFVRTLCVTGRLRDAMIVACNGSPMAVNSRTRIEGTSAACSKMLFEVGAPDIETAKDIGKAYINAVMVRVCRENEKIADKALAQLNNQVRKLQKKIEQGDKSEQIRNRLEDALDRIQKARNILQERRIIVDDLIWEDEQ